MTFEEWLDAEYPDRADRQSKFRMSSVRALMAAAWDAGKTAERERIENLYGQGDVAAPVGQSAWSEAYQEGWISGTQAYRDAIMDLGDAK